MTGLPILRHSFANPLWWGVHRAFWAYHVQHGVLITILGWFKADSIGSYFNVNIKNG